MILDSILSVLRTISLAALGLSFFVMLFSFFLVDRRSGSPWSAAFANLIQAVFIFAVPIAALANLNEPRTDWTEKWAYRIYLASLVLAGLVGIAGRYFSDGA